MLKMPDEPGLIPFGIYQAWREGTPNQVFVRSHTDLGNGLFLIEFTNAKSGKSRAWRTAVVREGVVSIFKDNVWQPGTVPTWVDLGIAKSATRHGEAMFKAEVPRPVKKLDEWRYKYSSQIYGPTLDEVTRDMIALVRSIYEPSRN